LTTSVLVTQLGRLTNDVGDALSHPLNSASTHSVLCAFVEVTITTTKCLCSDGGGVQLWQRTSCDPFLQWLLRDVTEPPVVVVTLSSNGLR
jgi:hypothetical protein